jgi:hypothetical protein
VVADGHLDIDLANGMLQVFGLPEPARRWTVRVGLTVVCEVSATDSDEASDAAEDAVVASLA